MNLIRLATIVAPTTLVILSTAHATPSAAIQERPNEYPYTCQFASDALALRLLDGDKELLVHKFCSAYGEASARVVADRRGHSYLLLELGEGHGTNATTRYLVVHRIARELIEIARIPISDAAGSQARWTYEYSVTDLPAGGLKIVMNLRIEGDDVECCVPPDKRLTIQFDAQ